MQKTAFFASIFFAASAFCQTSAKEPETLQALLSEVNQLRQDIEGMTVASQRVQIALYSLQMQDAAVARSAQRMDGAHTRCLDADQGRQHTTSEIQRMEGSLAAGTLPQNEAEAAKQRVNDLKRQLDAQTAQYQACQAGEADASTQLRNDQAKLLELQDRISRLDKALEQFGGAVK
jgi:chromosome segregation ATPase